MAIEECKWRSREGAGGLVTVDCEVSVDGEMSKTVAGNWTFAQAENGDQLHLDLMFARALSRTLLTDRRDDQ